MSMERWFDEAKANTVEDVALYLVRVFFKKMFSTLRLSKSHIMLSSD